MDDRNNFEYFTLDHIISEVTDGFYIISEGANENLKKPHLLPWLIGARTALNQLEKALCEHINRLSQEDQGNTELIRISEDVADRVCKTTSYLVKLPCASLEESEEEPECIAFLLPAIGDCHERAIRASNPFDGIFEARLVGELSLGENLFILFDKWGILRGLPHNTHIDLYGDALVIARNDDGSTRDLSEDEIAMLFARYESTDLDDGEYDSIDYSDDDYDDNDEEDF